jgi:biopolymer transport protein ExbD
MLPRRVKPNLVMEVKSQINVTPLVDVCLVLLIIFMVVTPMLERSALVAPPATRRPKPLPETSRQLTIAIRPDGGIWIGTDPIAERDLPAALRRAQLRDPDRKVMIRADRKLKYRVVLAAMRAARAAGFSGVGLVTRLRVMSVSPRGEPTRKLDLRGGPPATQGRTVSPPA